MRILAGLFLTAMAAVPSMAQEAPVALHGYGQLMTSYLGRGLAQSVGQPAVEADLEADFHSGLYLELDATSINWIDQLHPGDSVSVEVDGILAWRRAFAEDWSWQAGILRMQFPGRYVAQDPPVAEPHTTEAFAQLGWRGLSAKLNYALTESFGTPDSRGSWYLDTRAAWPLGDWTLGAHLGRKHARGVDPSSGLRNDRFGYTDWKLSVEYRLGAGLSLTALATGTDADQDLYTLNGYRVAGRHAALALKKAF